MFKYIWIAILALIYIGWIINVLRMKKGMSWYGWWENYCKPLIFIHISLLFLVSFLYCLYATVLGG